MSDWYPGHIARAASRIRSNARLVDVIIEVVDARAPVSSRYAHHYPYLRDKARVLIMARADLADDRMTARWRSYLSHKENITVIPYSKGTTSRRHLLDALGSSRRRQPLACMVVGMPNVGKSTVLNTIAVRSKARTGARPGVTRGIQWVECPGGITILDMPGVVLPHRPSPRAVILLSALDIIPEGVMPVEELADFILDHILLQQPELLQERYDLDSDLPREHVLDEIGRRRGALQAGGVVDRERASRHVLSDLRDGRLGLWTFDEVPGDDDG